MSARRLPATSYAALKSSWRRLVAQVGGIDALAAGTRIGRSQASDYGNAAVDDKYAPIDVVLDAEIDLGEPVVTRALAAAQGYELTPVDTRDACQLCQALSRIGSDTGSLLADACTVLSGGPISSRTREKMLVDLHDMRAAAARALQLLQVPA